MPQPKALTSRAKPLPPAPSCVLGEHELGDVGGAGDEHDRAGGEDQRAHERVAQDARACCAGRASSASVAAAGRRRPRRRIRNSAETAKVSALTASTSSGDVISRTPAASAGPLSWPISRTAPKRPLAALRRVGCTIAGSSAQVAGRRMALPRPAASARAIELGRAVGEDQPEERERADQVGGDRAAQAAAAVDHAAQQRAEQHRGGEVGDQDRGRAPGRAELLVGQQQQRHVAGAGAERALEVRGEEPARRALRAPHRGDSALISGRLHGRHPRRMPAMRR